MKTVTNSLSDLLDTAGSVDTSVWIAVGILVLALIVLITITKRQTQAALDAPYVDWEPKRDAEGNPVVKTMPDGTKKEVLQEVPISKDVLDPRSPNAADEHRAYFAEKAANATVEREETPEVAPEPVVEENRPQIVGQHPSGAYLISD